MTEGTETVVRHRDSAGHVTTGTLLEILPGWKQGVEQEERWLFVTPHDDDPAVAAAMLLGWGADAGAEIRIRVVTDGSMGYTPSVPAGDIVRRRQAETRESFSILGIDDVQWYGYPDSTLHLWQGRRAVSVAPVAEAPPAPHIVSGYTGLQNSITAEIRQFNPSRILLMSAADYHPDHKVVHQETMISIFHAQGDIWPELGPPKSGTPWVHEFAAYAPFQSPPDLQINGSPELFARKLAAIEAFRSQTQIQKLVENVRDGGAREYARSFPFRTYDPREYGELFG